MGLPAFVDDPALSEGGESMRLLLTPSFNPELCITSLFNGGVVTAEVRTLSKMFWKMAPAAVSPEVFVVTVTLPHAPFAKARAKMEHALREVQENQNKIGVVDGIGANFIFRSASERIELRANVALSEQLRRLVATMLRQVHAGLPKGECRRALAVAGDYVEIRLSAD